MRYDAAGRPLGEELTDWHGAMAVESVILPGRFCCVEPFNTAKHAAGLRAALAEDLDGAGWVYLMPAPECDADWVGWFSKMQESRDPLYFAIVSQETGQALGVASYQRIDPANGVVEVGWLHFSPALQHTAAATEAMYLMMRQAFDWGYRRYEWKCNVLNAASMRAAKRLGFSFEGIFRQARVNWGLNRDTAWFSLLDGEWPLTQQAFETWLAADNFDAEGQQRRSLAACRQALMAQAA